MNKVDIHSALARGLGDAIIPPLASSSNPIPDGVRFSTAQRNNYLYRAMLAILDEILRGVDHLERKDANLVLYKMIPNMITRLEYSLSFFSSTYRAMVLPYDSRIARILSAWGDSNYTNPTLARTSLPIHIMRNKGSYDSARLTLRPDAYLYMDNAQNFVVTDNNNELMDGGSFVMEVVMYPTDPALLQNFESVPFEESQISKIIQLAMMYAWQDSEDLENASMIAQSIKPIQQQGQRQ